jgi:hypothetical protein
MPHNTAPVHTPLFRTPTAASTSPTRYTRPSPSCPNQTRCNALHPHMSHRPAHHRPLHSRNRRARLTKGYLHRSPHPELLESGQHDPSAGMTRANVVCYAAGPGCVGCCCGCGCGRRWRRKKLGEETRIETVFVRPFELLVTQSERRQRQY